MKKKNFKIQILIIFCFIGFWENLKPTYQQQHHRRVIQKQQPKDRTKKPKKTTSSSGIDITIKKEMGGKTDIDLPKKGPSVSDLVKQIKKQRDPIKKIELLKQAINQYYILTTDKKRSKHKVSYRTGNNIMYYLLSMIRSASRYKPEQITALINFLNQSTENKSITSLPNSKFIKKVPEYINKLEIKFLLKQAKLQKNLAGKAYWYLQAINKLSDKSKNFNTSKMFFEINALIKSTKKPNDKMIIKPLINALKLKKNFFHVRQRKIIDQWSQAPSSSTPQHQ